jgi:hypothetical protein
MLLHVVEGRVVELEIYRMDGETIQGEGVPVPLTVTVNGPGFADRDNME